jgi:hypothetical protein
MKQNSVDGFDKQKSFGRRQRDQLPESVQAGEAGGQFAMRIIWLVLGAVCAALGWVLLTILLR